MPDPRFFHAAGPFTLAQLAEIAGAKIHGGVGEQVIHDVAPLDTAGADDISFLDNPAYTEAFAASKAGVCIVGENLKAPTPSGMTLLIAKDAYRAYAFVAQAFYPDALPVPGVGAGASVDPSAIIGEGSEIAPGAVIGANVEIGKACRIGANAVVGTGVKMGDNCDIGPLVSLKCAVLGHHVRIYAGARIGEDGFGYASDASGHTHIPQLGRVLVGDGVEIGANTTIDRGSGPDTVIGEGSIIDNLVQIGHNVRLGRYCIIVSHVGISGSTTLGDYVVIGGQVGIAGHLKIGDGVRVGAQAGVIGDLEKGATVIGSPALPHREFWRQVATLKRLSALPKGKSK
jgi:UDP-3-O-[3-hydroxymyristoyl] glucosamine N-acyltransferase